VNKHKVVIVGGGPGGAATAVELLQRGVRDVVLVDKDPFPRDKTCGSALSPNALKTIKQLGIDAEVRELGYLIHSLIVVTPGHREMKLTTDHAAIVLLRKYFDNLLVERAKKLGVELRTPWKAVELVREGSRVIGVRGRPTAAGADTSKDEVIYGDYVIAADGAHSIFSWDNRPKRTISTLMGWWEDFPIESGTMEMVFDKNLLPLYGWMFPESNERVNIGICMEGEEKGPDGNYIKTTRNVREVFAKFLDDHYRDRLASARQVGKFKGHPISYTTWIRDLVGDGIVYIGEGGRMTHNATGEGIFHAMQSGIFCADAIADIVVRGVDEKKALANYQTQARKRFTFGFVMGHVLRGALKTPLFDVIAAGYNSPSFRKVATWALGSALAGSTVGESEAPIVESVPPSRAAAN
jgi:flavin-dependent dehydrogenase